MKDHEIRDNLEKELFRAKETVNTLKASLKADDGKLKHLAESFEKQKNDIEKIIIRKQNAIKNHEKRIEIINKKLGKAEETIKQNIIKNRLLHKIQQKKQEAQKPKSKHDKLMEMVKEVDDVPEAEPTKIEEIQELLDELPKPEPKENGKMTCPLCSKEFSKQGFPAHFKSCSAKFIEEEGE